MAIKLYRCSNTWVKLQGHPCWKVQSALDEQGDRVRGRRHCDALSCRRVEVEQLSGQRAYPVIQFEDGSVYREESKEMAATIRAGKLDEKRGGATPAA